MVYKPKKNKITKHTILCPQFIISEVKSAYYAHNMYVDVKGIVFSDRGADGRTPICDVSTRFSEDIFAYWEDKANGIICVSHCEPGYDILAPKNMDEFFSGIDDVMFLDVSHLNVSKSENLKTCFIGFSTKYKGEIKRIKGLECWES